MDNRYNKEEDKYEGITLDCEKSTPDQPNTDQVIDSDDETETMETLLEDYYKANIDHNYPNFHMIWEIVKEESKYLRVSI